MSTRTPHPPAPLALLRPGEPVAETTLRLHGPGGAVDCVAQVPDLDLVLLWARAWWTTRYPDGDRTPDDYVMPELKNQRLTYAALGLCLAGGQGLVVMYDEAQPLEHYGPAVLRDLHAAGVRLATGWNVAVRAAQAVLDVAQRSATLPSEQEVEDAVGFSGAGSEEESGSACASASASAEAMPSGASH